MTESTGNDWKTPRLVVTGHDAQGTSVVVSDAPVADSHFMEDGGVSFHELWRTNESPADISVSEKPAAAPGDLGVVPSRGGTKLRINELKPGHLDELGNQSPMHRTETIDYAIVLEGEVVLVLEDSEVTLKTGDIAIQRGTLHAWANRSDKLARVAFVLIDGTFDPALVEKLPADFRDKLM